MARPTNVNPRPLGPPWATDWTRPPAMMPYGVYPQQYPYMNPMIPSAPSQPLKRPHSESSPNTNGAGSKDHHILWMGVYDKPIPDVVKAKCKPLYCELCSVNLNSVIQAKMHYEGKLHEKKVRFALQTWAKENNTVPPKKKQTNSGSESNESIGPPVAQRPRYEYPYDPRQDLYCGPCDTSFTSHAHAQQHFSGRNHKRVMNGMAPLKAGYFNTRTGKWQRQPPQDEDVKAEAGGAPPLPSGMSVIPPPPPPEPQEQVPVVSPEGPKFFCNICGVNATSQVQLDMHLNGRNHKARFAKLNMQQQPGFNQYPPGLQQSVLAASQISSPVPVVAKPDQHETKAKPKNDYSIYRTPSGQYYCALCNLSVNSENHFVQHIDSRKHKLKESSAKGKKSKSKK